LKHKVLSGIYDTSVTPEIPIISEYGTRGNSLKIANRTDVTTTFGSYNYKCMEQPTFLHRRDKRQKHYYKR